jgi:hypothetical protein
MRPDYLQIGLMMPITTGLLVCWSAGKRVEGEAVLGSFSQLEICSFDVQE